jgi:hypothetical protein
MKKRFVAVGLLLSLLAAESYAIVIDFEQYAQGTTITNQYAGLGVSFSGGAQMLVSPNYNFSDYPPHSGSGVIYNGVGPSIRADAIGGSWANVGVFATSASAFYMDVYNSSNILLATVSTPANTVSQGGPANAFLNYAGPGIAYAIFHDSGNAFVLDDFTFTQASTSGSAVPDGGSTAALLGMAFTGIAWMRRRLT